MKCDVHLHSSFSFDSAEEQENYVIKAREEGVKIIGFAEHYDMDAYLQGDDLGLLDPEPYFANIMRLRKKYPDTEILAGVEMGYSEEAVPACRKLISDYPFDSVTFSVHTLPAYGDFCYGRAFEGRTTAEAYEDYLKAVLGSVKADADKNIIAHIGYCQRYCRAPDGDMVYASFPALFDEILSEIIARGLCLELNTSAGGRDFLPDRTIADRYTELGGTKFSFGSDAHSAERLADGYGKVCVYLRSRGIDSLTYYRDGREMKFGI